MKSAPQAADYKAGEGARMAPSPAPMPYGQPMAPGVTADGDSAGTPHEESEPSPPAMAGGKKGKSAYTKSSGVKAGEWDDNANYQDFRKYLLGAELTSGFKTDISKRRFIVVRDADGKAVPNCVVSIADNNQKQTGVKLTTTSSGRALFFPKAESLTGNLVASTSCLGSKVSKSFNTTAADGVVDIQLKQQRSLPKKRTIDIAFILDTTGSMSEEIDAVKGTIRKVSGMLAKMNVNVRVGLVEYRDVTDKFTTRVYPMTSNINKFAKKVDKLSANGGGDTPEHMNEGLRVAVSQLKWNKSSVARMAFLVGDAPPHLDYDNDVEYTNTMQQANHGGIQIFTIAASGMDDAGQAVWRQIAQYTGGTNMFVLRGGAGPQSTGAGDAKSSCGGTHKNYSSGNLSGLISDKIKLTLKLVDTDPMLIAGLGQDERAKPCDKRVVIAR